MGAEKGKRMKKRDMIGFRSGRLTVVGYDEWKHGRPYLICECDCGNVLSVRDDAIVGRRTKSCGCLQREAPAKYYASHKKIGSQNNESRDRLHNIWYLMKYRCENEKCEAYNNYGGRGITVCGEWSDDDFGYYAFKEWALSHGYSDGLTIDRVDNNGNYSPDNCKWSTDCEQANNKRDNVFLTYNGETKTAAQWARELNVNYSAFINRVYLGWDTNRIFEQPYRKSRRV